jgi:large subunit ribosomal protein L10
VARPDKVAAVADVRENLTSSAATLLTNYRGLSVGELAELRAELRKANARYRVAKNTLTLIAARDAGMDGLEDLLSGPTALVFCEDDPVGPAKALKAFAKDHPALEFKGGYLDGAVLDAEEALKLADLASREELLARLAGLMHGALANTARLLNALPQKQAQLIQALIEAGGASTESSPGAPTAEAADDAEAADEATTAAPAGEDVVAEANEADAEGESAEGEPNEDTPVGEGASDDDEA